MGKQNPSTNERLAILETLMTNHLAHHEKHEKLLIWFIGLIVPVLTILVEFGLRKWLG